MCSSTKAAPMTKDEVMLLVQLVAANKVINNKATNATNNKLKEEAWQTLTNEFNSSITTFPRTPAQLRLKWENLKSARKRCANMRSSLNKTGGGKDYFPPDEVLEKVASILGSTCEGFTVEFGGDASSSVICEATVNIEDGHIVNLIGDVHADGDGVYTEGVTETILVKEKPILEHSTPSLQQKNFFLNRASGSGTLAKRKHKLEEEKAKARIFRENALGEYLIAKKKKVDLENEEKEILIAKLKLELENARLENLKLKSDLNL